MAALKRDAVPSSLGRVMCEFNELVNTLEAGLLRSLDDAETIHEDDIRREACRLAMSELSTKYVPKYLRRSLSQAESEGKRLEEQLHSLCHSQSHSLQDLSSHDANDLATLPYGHFRLFSSELFHLLGQPTQLRFGTLRFNSHSLHGNECLAQRPSDLPPRVTIELALNNSFFTADSMETLPYHTFRLPSSPSLQNRGILSRKPQDDGAFPDFDSWLLFTFLGNGCIKVEVSIEMCADIYGGRLRGRQDDEVIFWGFFVDDDQIQ